MNKKLFSKYCLFILALASTLQVQSQDNLSVASIPTDIAVLSSATPSIPEKSSSIFASDIYSRLIHPKAIAFIKDYQEENEKHLYRLKMNHLQAIKQIESILEKHGIPKELKYLAIIESELKSSARSHAGAVGPWQLMPVTGRDYGLVVNKKRDERMDLIKSTHAAAKYLKTLHKKFNDWLLVIAAFNSGEGRVSRAMASGHSDNYWEIEQFLPKESRGHVRRYIATHYILEGSGGTTTTTSDLIAGLEKAITFDTTSLKLNRIQITGKFHSYILSKMVGMETSLFQFLNPGFDGKVAIDNYTLCLPEEKMELFNQNRAAILEASVQYLLLGLNFDMNITDEQKYAFSVREKINSDRNKSNTYNRLHRRLFPLTYFKYS